MPANRKISREDILEIGVYEADRKRHRAEIAEIKKSRRLPVGPSAMFHFECFATIWYQIQEMVRIERGGEAQIAGELAAYDPLVPNGAELTATVMFEIADEPTRDRLLSALGGVEQRMNLAFAGETVRGVPEEDVERSRADGKASSVHFMHFPMTPAQIEKFREPGAQVTVGITHENYGHLAIMPEAMRLQLAGDFDIT
jgi:hypothetical protein